MRSSLLEYQSFIDDVDSLCRRLFDIHRSHVCCAEGCASCCTNLSVLPVEWYAVRSGIPMLSARSGMSIHFDSQAPCGYLADDACSIYPLRPLICRTHGLPILYQVEEYDPDGRRVPVDWSDWSPPSESEEPHGWLPFRRQVATAETDLQETQDGLLSWCDLHFRCLDPGRLDAYFTLEKVIDVESLNVRLRDINREFLQTPEGRRFGSDAPIPMRTAHSMSED